MTMEGAVPISWCYVVSRWRNISVKRFLEQRRIRDPTPTAPNTSSDLSLDDSVTPVLREAFAWKYMDRQLRLISRDASGFIEMSTGLRW